MPGIQQPLELVAKLRGNSIAIGYLASSADVNTMAIGVGFSAAGTSASAFGADASALGDRSFAAGYNSIARGSMQLPLAQKPMLKGQCNSH